MRIDTADLQSIARRQREASRLRATAAMAAAMKARQAEAAGAR